MHGFQRQATAFTCVWSFAAVLAILGHLQLVPSRLKLADLVDMHTAGDGARPAAAT